MRLSSFLLVVVAASLLCFSSSCESSGYDDYDDSGSQDFPKPDTSLTAAITIAQKKMPEGRCISAGIGGAKFYTVTLVGGGTRRQILIDPKDGSVMTSSDIVVDTDSQALLDELSKLKPGVDALKAVKSASGEESSYRPLAVQLGNETGKGLLYQVLLVKGKKAKVARISPANGSVQSIVDADSDR